MYSYITFNNNIRVEKNITNITDIWNEMIIFFNIFLESKCPSTIYWVYEILNLMLLLLPVREAHNKALRNTLFEIVSRIFSTVLKFSNNNFEILFEESTTLITPINPSVYELIALEVYSKNIVEVKIKMFDRHSKLKNELEDNKLEDTKNKVSDDPIKEFYKYLYDYVLAGTVIKNEDLLTIYRNIGFITMKNLFYNSMKNIYLPDRMDKFLIHVKITLILDNYYC